MNIPFQGVSPETHLFQPGVHLSMVQATINLSMDEPTDKVSTPAAQLLSKSPTPEHVTLWGDRNIKQSNICFICVSFLFTYIIPCVYTL